jgi:hypothetical protein
VKPGSDFENAKPRLPRCLPMAVAQCTHGLAPRNIPWLQEPKKNSTHSNLVYLPHKTQKQNFVKTVVFLEGSDLYERSAPTNE